MKNYDPGRGNRWTCKKQRSFLPAAVHSPGEVGVGSEALRLQLTLPTRSRTVSVQNVAKAAGCDCLLLTDCSPPILFLFKEGKISTMTPLLNSCIFLWSLEFPGYNLCCSRWGVPTVDTAEVFQVQQVMVFTYSPLLLNLNIWINAIPGSEVGKYKQW